MTSLNGAASKDAVSIGPLRLRGPVALAPMSGLSDVPLRTIAWELGAGYLVSEMVSSKLALWDTEKSRRRREQVPGVRPAAVQLAGADPAQLAESAVRHVEEGADIIDLNFGCPAKKVCNKAAGSALLENEALVSTIVAAVVRAVDVPVTVKTRTGSSPARRKAVRIARLVEDAGACALFLHGRTRACRFNGLAEYESARAVRAAIGIPLFVNGDIDTVEKAREVLRHTEADGLMVGRAAVGAPWLLTMIGGGAEPSLTQKWGIIARHLRLIHEFYGKDKGPRIARKHVGAYLRKLGFAEGARDFNLLAPVPELQCEWLDSYQRHPARATSTGSGSPASWLSVPASASLRSDPRPRLHGAWGERGAG